MPVIITSILPAAILLGILQTDGSASGNVGNGGESGLAIRFETFERVQLGFVGVGDGTGEELGGAGCGWGEGGGEEQHGDEIRCFQQTSVAPENTLTIKGIYTSIVRYHHLSTKDFISPLSSSILAPHLKTMHRPSIQTQALLFAHHPPTPLYILPRGGAINTLLENAPFIDAASLNDDDLDRMVDDLIAGAESEEENESEEEEEEEETANESFEVEGDDDNEGSEEQNVSAESSEEEDTTVDPSIDAPVEATAPTSTTSSSTVVQQPSINKSSQPQSSNTNITYKPTPTNAYYRFLLRRGPKGHILACFTLLSVQWIYTYLPLLYNVTSSILRTLHIYDPSRLELYERRRLLRERDEKVSIGSKLMKKFGKRGSDDNKETKQRQSDQSATFKLQQLYKTISSSSSSMDRWENVRYSYLSVGFRKRHELGREYVTVRPKTFMGESVGSGDYLSGEEEEAVVLDDDDDDDRLNNAESEQEQGDGMSMDKKKKRRKVTDWVVSSFANRHFTPSNPAAAAAAASSISKLWKSVHQDAILSAAWSSRNAEKSIWKISNNDSIIHHHRTNHFKSNQSSISNNNNSIAASKMFASVMTRVGSNGRLLGAYPMDALPIDQCCNKRGVLELARRYGYGDWKDDTMFFEEEEDEMEDGWGGGDLFNEDVEGWKNNSSSRRSKSKRKKQKTVNNTVDGLDETRSRRRRRRKKKIE